MKDDVFSLDKFEDECGVIGIYKPGDETVSQMLCYGLVALQHRGQESAGIAVTENGKINYYKEMGLVQEVFNDKIIQRLQGGIGIGHVRYSTTGESYVANAQPLVVQFKGGSIALAHNGNLVNADQIREDLENKGSIFTTSIDTEVIASLIAKNFQLGVKESIVKACEEIKGAYALVILIDDKLIGVRDPFALRPLCLGQFPDGGYILASETSALDVVGADYVRDIDKGEMVIITAEGVESYYYDTTQRKALCCFEYVYFARPDSIMDGQSVYISRRNAGRILYAEHPAEADLVIAVPDSGTAAAIGYAEASGIPMGIGLIKNKYLGRTFIQPDQRLREISVRLKLNVLKDNIKGKRLVLIDDSIVRGTTSKRIVDMLLKAGAKEVHMRVSSPPVTHPCFFGIDTPTKKQLVGAFNTVEEIKTLIGADSLGYISIKGLMDSIGQDANNLCAACFNGDYPMGVPDSANKFLFEKE